MQLGHQQGKDSFAAGSQARLQAAAAGRAGMAWATCPLGLELGVWGSEAVVVLAFTWDRAQSKPGPEWPGGAGLEGGVPSSTPCT